jgi:hypothetical protein
MPIRGLMYFGNLYEAYIDKNNKNIYGTTLIKLPTPQYVVFYNGTADQKPLKKLKLSDAFIHPDTGREFEWTATMYNLNKGKNDNLLHRCKPLSDYMTLVNYIRDNQKSGMPAKKAIDAAVKRCIKENVLRDFLKKHRAEVMDVCLTEYNEEVFVNGIREDGRAEGFIDGRAEGLADGRAEGFIDGRAEGFIDGRAEGLAAGHADSIRTLLRKGKSPAEIHDLLDYPMEEIAEVSKKLQ